jgi:23S rRNA G2445 N2-methylase RlmL
MLRRQLGAVDGVEVTGTGFDGRTDIVFFTADRASRAEALRSALAEDVLAEIGRASRAGGADAAAVAAMAWQPAGVQRALSVWADEVRPLAGTMTFRVRSQLRSEARVRRADLRRSMDRLVARDKPRWRHAESADLTIWISEFHDGQYVAGLRLSDAGQPMRAGHGATRPGELPRTVAAAMVALARPPGGSQTLLDPCCGSGRVLAAAQAAGWQADGGDIDAAAVDAAAAAAPGASVQLGDARELLLPDASVGACVSRLPFGRMTDEDWVAAVLAEMSRVTRSGGSVVLLAPQVPRSVIPAALRLRRQVPLRVLGTAATIWVFRRA